MCPPKPKIPASVSAPPHMAAVLPDGGDPMVRQGLRGQRSLARSAMIFTNQQGGLGMPSTATLGSGS